MAKEDKVLNAKQMLADVGAEGVKFRYSDRQAIEYLKDYGKRKAGEVVTTTAKFKADWLIANGVAKEAKAEVKK